MFAPLFRGRSRRSFRRQKSVRKSHQQVGFFLGLTVTQALENGRKSPLPRKALLDRRAKRHNAVVIRFRSAVLGWREEKRFFSPNRRYELKKPTAGHPPKRAGLKTPFTPRSMTADWSHDPANLKGIIHRKIRVDVPNRTPKTGSPSKREVG